MVDSENYLATAPPIPIYQTPQYRERQRQEQLIAQQNAQAKAEYERKLLEQQTAEAKANKERQLYAEFEEARRLGKPASREVTEFIEQKLLEQGYTQADLRREVVVGRARNFSSIYEGGYSSVSGGESSREGAGFYVMVKPNIGGYTSASGGTGLATYTPESGSVTNLIASRSEGGFIQLVEPTYTPAPKSLPKEKSVPSPFEIAIAPIKNAVPNQVREINQRQRESLERINQRADAFVSDIASGAGSVLYEVNYASKKNSFFNQDFYRDNFATRPLAPKSEVDRARTQVVFSDVALKAQYLIPVYGETKIGADVVGQYNRGDLSFVESLAYGGLAYFTFKAVGKGLTKLENLPTNKEFEFLGPEAKASLDKIYENTLSKQKPIRQPSVETGFVSKNAEKQLLKLEQQGSFSQNGFVSPKANQQLTIIDSFLKKQKTPRQQSSFASPEVLSYLTRLELSGTLTAPNKFVSLKAEKQLDSIYKGLAKQKDIPNKEDVDLFKELPPKKFDDKAFVRKGAEVLVGTTLLAPIVYSTYAKKNLITSEYDIASQKRLAFEESTREARSFGSAKFGYQIAEFGGGSASRYVYEAKAILTGKKALPEAELISPQVKSGETSYPKATMDAKAFKRFFEQSSETPLAKKYFERFTQGFNVSQGRLPKEYLPQAGTSEFSGQYYAPRYPSTTFGIPKGSEGTLDGYSILPRFEALNGPPVANVLYGKGVRLVDVTGKGKGALNKLDPGYFYVPTIGRLRTKSESEAIQNINTLVKLTKNRYYFIEKTVSKQRGYPAGVFFEIPEYEVAGLRNNQPASQLISLQRLNFESAKRYDTYYGSSRKQPLSVYNPSSSKQRIRDPYLSSSSRSRASYRNYSSGYKSLSRIPYSASPSKSSPKYFGRPYYLPKSSDSPSRVSLPSYSTPSSSSSVVYYSKSGQPSRPTYSPQYYPRPSGSKPRSYPNPIRYSDSSQKNFRPGYNVLYRTGGKTKLLQGEFTRNDAIARGENLLGKTLRASFKIVASGGVAVERGISRLPLKGYYNKKGFFVQARGTRLNSREERFEIQSAKRSKRRGFF